MFMQDISRLSAEPVSAEPIASPALPRPTAPHTRAALAMGMFGPTLVETEKGWTPASELRIGDRLHTLDGGLQHIAALSRRAVLPAERAVKIKGGHFDACDDLMLLPGQPVLLQTVSLMAAPYARLKASALTSTIGATITLAPQKAEIITPIFAEEEAIWAQSGVLLLCPGIRDSLSAYPAVDDTLASFFLTERQRRFG
ncbi:Hint domain-containing protein [Xinfangfangia sp. CPCC 101601]|uniref:Hint domain-containing protein n=1 Tax=Pseudogemmobacter lacusdianii TaxID=3069608 RepID=A0ABU0W184_9RHOB|nr:Hint domain-containing protein [Xinfangfangia sp. CPCC 101601]MDQ2066855.1 Hint domain-containing protein [Xinfangfangia sp. CPCC 101601]